MKMTTVRKCTGIQLTEYTCKMCSVKKKSRKRNKKKVRADLDAANPASPLYVIMICREGLVAMIVW